MAELEWRPLGGCVLGILAGSVMLLYMIGVSL